MHKPLADAIVTTFYLQQPIDHGALLSSFATNAWTDTYLWLDASGLGLYFLDRLKELSLEGSVPSVVLERLERNMADNRARTADTFAEFARLNRALTAAGITFVNLKGISLVPSACPDPALRLQLDLDLLIEMRQVQACAVALGKMDYVLTGVSGSVWEFKAGASTLPSVADLYKAKPQRSVEVHFQSNGQTAKLAARREWVAWEGFSFPVLSDPDLFILQATHVLKHIRSEWTRLSWLLEFRTSVLHWKSDRAFWQQVREQGCIDTEVRTAVGVAVVLATIVFGAFAPEDITSWAVDALDPQLRLWLDCYGRQAIMAEFPGTKLYLLQPDSIEGMDHLKFGSKRKKLLPLHNAPQIVHGADGIVARLRGCSAQLSFVLFRLRFHVTEGWRYLMEAPRWKKILAASRQPHSTLIATNERGLL